MIRTLGAFPRKSADFHENRNWRRFSAGAHQRYFRPYSLTAISAVPIPLEVEPESATTGSIDGLMQSPFTSPRFPGLPILAHRESIEVFVLAEDLR